MSECNYRNGITTPNCPTCGKGPCTWDISAHLHGPIVLVEEPRRCPRELTDEEAERGARALWNSVCPSLLTWDDLSEQGRRVRVEIFRAAYRAITEEPK